MGHYLGKADKDRQKHAHFPWIHPPKDKAQRPPSMCSFVLAKKGARIESKNKGCMKSWTQSAELFSRFSLITPIVYNVPMGMDPLRPTYLGLGMAIA